MELARPPVSDIRSLLMQAALKVYAEVGTRGATTRRMAQEAGVNEVTLFRHFGSKEQLIREALGMGANEALPGGLPPAPVDPSSELEGFAIAYHAALCEHRSLIRKTMGEFEEHPDVCTLACRRPVAIATDLARYLNDLRAAGLAVGNWDARAASNMLMGSLFADALSRECMPELYDSSHADAVRGYVHLFLRAIGVDTSGKPRTPRRRRP